MPDILTPIELDRLSAVSAIVAGDAWRTGRKVHRTLYAGDRLIGVLDFAGDATFCAAAQNLVGKAVATILKLTEDLDAWKRHAIAEEAWLAHAMGCPHEGCDPYLTDDDQDPCEEGRPIFEERMVAGRAVGRCR